MKHLKSSLWALGMMVFVVIFMSCQNTITDHSSEIQQTQIKLVTGTQHSLAGLAKSVSKNIVAENGGFLGGAQMDGNYLYIPPGALSQNIHFRFSVDVDENGVVVFDIRGDGYEEEHIYLQNGLTATMAVNKDWLDSRPNVVVNYDDLNDFFDNVWEDESHYLVQVDHFSKWSWGILEDQSP